MRKKLSLVLTLFLASLTGSVFAQISADKTYKIANYNDANLFMQDNGTGGVALGAANDNSYWQFVPTENTDCYYIKNATTGKFIQGYNATEQEVATGDAGVEYFVKADASGNLEGKYRMSCTANTPHDFSDGTLGLNWKVNNVVQSFASVASANPRSAWILTEAEVPQPSLPTIASPFTGAEVGNGDFFIYNPASGLWLQNNDKNTGDWNTRGATGDYGFEFGISAIDGGWKLDPKFGHNHSMNISNFYLDTNDGASAWKVEKIETENGIVAYQIKADDGRVLSLNNDKNLDWNTGNADVWQFVTKAERIKYMKKNATEESPIDATFLINDPRFVNENERAASWSWNIDYDGGARDDVRWFRNRRSYAVWNVKSVKLTQTIANIPNGKYKLKIKGFYRDGDKDNVAARRAAGEERLLGKYFINEDKASAMSILDGATENWVDGIFFYPAADADAPYGHYPDNADGFNRAFQDYPNNYMNAGVVSEITTGEMVIGLEKLEKNANDWFAFDEFSLEYLGNPAGVDQYREILNTAITNAEAFDATTTSTALATALDTAISNAKAKVESTDTDEIDEVTAALNTALAAAKSVNIVALKATAELAKADQLDVAAAENAITNATTADEVEQALYDLRAARKINALQWDKDPFKGSAPAAGKVYLFNVGTRMFLGTGSDWNTHAAVDQVGIEIELVDLDTPETNNFKIKTGRGSGWMAYNGYVDCPAQDIWHFLPVEGKEGVYNLSSNGQDGFLLGYNPNKGTDGKKYWSNFGIDQTGLDNPMNQWKIITPAERAAMIEAASEENPVDVSYLIKNASLNRQDGYDMWAKECDGGNGGARVSTVTDNNGDRAADYAWEYFEPNSFSFTQTIGGLKAGKYIVAVQGLFRNGNGDDQANAIAENADNMVQLSYLCANDEKAFLPNIASVTDLVPGIGDLKASVLGDFPNMPGTAIEFFEHGAYWTTVEVEVGEDGVLTLGVKKDSRELLGDWTVFDNFRLVYFGDPVSAAKEDLSALITTAKAIDTTGKTAASASALATAITEAEAALAAEGATVESLTAAKTALQDAINGLEDDPTIEIRAELTTLIATAKAIDTTGDTAASADALATAISNAEAALAAEGATVESLTAAKTALQDAINGLEVDGINTIGATAKAGKIYNAQGQKVNKAQKGIIILNKKKVVVK